MRYYILLFVFLILSSINAQEKYASFKQPSGNVVDIQIDTDKLQVYFPLHYSGDSGIILENEKSRLAFLDFLNSSFDKFEEWEKTAKENDVKDFDKDIASKRLGDTHYFKYGSWQFKWGKSNIYTKMKISEEGTAYFYVITPSYASSSNDYIESDLGILQLDKEGILKINDALSTDTINNIKSKEEDLNSLFN